MAFLLFQKPVGSDAFNALTFNENVLSSPSKYGIQWTYNLTVYNLQPADAGLYRCTAGGVDYDATLTVVGTVYKSIFFPLASSK